MSLAPLSTSGARPPRESAERWIIASELHLGFAGRLREIWRYRRVLLFFASKSVQQLYKNTRLGVWWLLIRPLTPIIVGTLVFGQLMKVPTGGTPYFLFFAAGAIVWSLFTDPLTRGSRGLDVNRQLLTKLYLPRVILPAGQLAGGLVEPVVITGVFAASLWYYRYSTGVWYGGAPQNLPFAALAAFLSVLLAFSVALWTSVLQARARDVRYVLSYVVNFWFLLTPVAYPLSMMPQRLRWIAALNPMTGPVETFRWAVLGVGAPAWNELAISAGGIAVLFIGGLWFFTANESATVDKL
jgi:lipopolysaccharide transport system permease protein